MRAARRPYPHVDAPTRFIHAGDSVTLEIHFSGRTTGRLDLEFDAVDVFDFAADRTITRMSSWYESQEMRQQLCASREETIKPSIG